MAGPTLIEQEISTGTTNEAVYLPSEEKKWTSSVAQDAEKAAGQPFTPAEATPPAAQQIPTSKSGTQIQPGVNAEPFIDPADMADVVGKTAGHVVKSVGGEEGLLAHNETAPGRRGIFKLRERLEKLFHRK